MESVRRISELYQALRPLLLRDVAVAVGGAGASAAGGMTAGGMTAHALSSPWHTGSLAESQAPWAATKNEWATALATHAGLPDVHHAAATAGTLIALSGQQVSLASGAAYQFVGTGNDTVPEWRNVSELAGNGLTHAAGALSVGAGTLISVAADSVGLASGAAYQFVGTGNDTVPEWRNVSELAGNGLTATNGVLAVGVSGLGLSVAADAVTLASSSNPGAAASILASNASGYLTLVRVTTSDRVRTPLLDTAAGNLTVQPAADLMLSPGSNLVKLAAGKSLQSDGYASQATGMRVTAAGEGDFRYLFVDEMHAKSFIADLEQALAGGQIISKSVAVLALDFTLPAAGATGTLRVRDLPSAPNMAVFQSGDFVGLRQFSRAAGSLTIGWAWGTVTAYADQSDGTQTWTFTRNATTPGIASGTIAAESLALDFGVTGNGFYEVNAIDGAYGTNSPYWRIVTWATHPATQTVRVQGGNLRGLFGVANEYGFYAGDGTGTGNAYLRLSSQTNEFRNLTARWYYNAVQKAEITPARGLRFQADMSDPGWENTAGNRIEWLTNLAGDAGQIAKLYAHAGLTSMLYVSAEDMSSGRGASLDISARTAVGSATIGLSANGTGASNGYITMLAATSIDLNAPTVTINGNYDIWHEGNDGASSGLDADLLDGQHGNYYLAASVYTAADVLTKIKTVDGASSGLDADTLDTYQASAFALLSGATFTGSLLATSAVGYSWSELTPINNWINNGSPSATLGIKRFGSYVSVKGVVRANAAIASATAVSAQLPSEYRPTANRSFACVASISGAETVRRVYVDSSGYVKPVGAFSTNDWVSVEFSYFTGG